MRRALRHIRISLRRCALVVVLLTSGSNASAQDRCRSLFIPQGVEDLDTLAVENAYLAARPPPTQAGPALPSAPNLGGTDGISSRSAPDMEKRFDIAFMGPLGGIFDLRSSASDEKPVPILNPLIVDSVLARTLRELNGATTEPSPETLSLIRSAIGFQELTNETILVQTVTAHDASQNSQIQNAIRNRFNILYIQMANWTYRLSTLEPNESISSARMMDEVTEYAAQLRYFRFNFAYDKKIWEVQLKVLAHLIELYNGASSDDLKREALRAISSSELPLLPVAGVATAHHFFSEGAAVEVKRYFKNDFEDPLMLVKTADKEEYELRQKMLHRVFELLPPNTKLEVHAHSMLHVRNYRKLGFEDSGLITNPKYPDAEIHLLKARREVVLEKIAASLNKPK